MTEEIEPHILKKYEIVEKLGKGAYGIVWKAVDRKLKQIVALKKVEKSLRQVFDAFHNATDAQRTFRQVMFLQQLNGISPNNTGHENIIRLLNIIKAENNKDLYLVFDYMETGIYLSIKTFMSSLEQAFQKKYIKNLQFTSF